jgi:hypothetical protein
VHNTRTPSKGILSIIIVIALCSLWPSYVFHKKSAGNFNQGSAGEEEVFSELSKLPDTYTVFRDIQFPGITANVDFIVCGPTGAYAIEVKSHQRRTLFRPSYNMVQQALKEAMDTNIYVNSIINKKIYINAVLVFSHDHTRLTSTVSHIGKVTVLHKRTLLEFITSQPMVKNQTDIFLITQALIPLTYKKTFN